MDFFEKLDALHANGANPKKIKKVTEGSKDEVLQRVMDFVDKFDAKQKERVSVGRGTRPDLAGRAGLAGKRKRVGDVTFKFKKTKNGLIVVDKVGKKDAFVLRPEQLAGDVKKLVRGLGVEGIQLTGGERLEGSNVRRRLRKGPKGRPK